MHAIVSLVVQEAIFVSEKALRFGLLSSDPFSRRVSELETALQKLGVEAIHILPWKVKRTVSDGNYEIVQGNRNLTDLDVAIVLDIGASDIGSYLSRMDLLSALATTGVNLINSVEAIRIMRNKAETIRTFAHHGIPVPKTLITESIEDAAAFVNKNNPCVLKPLLGFGGSGVRLIEKQFDIRNIYDILKFHSQQYGKGAFLLQQYIENPGYDIRALVVDGEVIADMQRVSTDGIVTNIHAGGTARPNDLEIKDLAKKAARIVGGWLVGVDIIPDKKGECFVLEANATPGWTGLQSVTEISIAERIAESLVRKDRSKGEGF